MIKNNKLYYLSFVFLLSYSVFSQSSTAGYINYKAECLGTELDGSMTLKAWGSGRNNSDAVEQAKKMLLLKYSLKVLVLVKQFVRVHLCL